MTDPHPVNRHPDWPPPPPQFAPAPAPLAAMRGSGAPPSVPSDAASAGAGANGGSVPRAPPLDNDSTIWKGRPEGPETPGSDPPTTGPENEVPSSKLEKPRHKQSLASAAP